MNVYDFINWFFMYSFLGYLLECIVLSAEYKRPVVDRGFGHGPFCVIYGFGALGACMLLRPVSGSPMELYTASMAMATTMELVTANIMVRLFGSFWWDYSHKPFNYKGMVCLESSLAWDFWACFLLFSGYKGSCCRDQSARPCGDCSGSRAYHVLSGGFHPLFPPAYGRYGRGR